MAKNFEDKDGRHDGRGGKKRYTEAPLDIKGGEVPESLALGPISQPQMGDEPWAEKKRSRRPKKKKRGMDELRNPTAPLDVSHEGLARLDGARPITTEMPRPWEQKYESIGPAPKNGIRSWGHMPLGAQRDANITALQTAALTALPEFMPAAAAAKPAMGLADDAMRFADDATRLRPSPELAVPAPEPTMQLGPLNHDPGLLENMPVMGREPTVWSGAKLQPQDLMAPNSGTQGLAGDWMPPGQPVSQPVTPSMLLDDTFIRGAPDAEISQLSPASLWDDSSQMSAAQSPFGQSPLPKPQPPMLQPPPQMPQSPSAVELNRMGDRAALDLLLGRNTRNLVLGAGGTAGLAGGVNWLANSGQADPGIAPPQAFPGVPQPQAIPEQPGVMAEPMRPVPKSAKAKKSKTKKPSKSRR